MAIKFSQFNLRTDHTSGMYLVGYDGNQNIHITVDNLFDDFINGTENTIAMFGTGGTVLADSILLQDAGATLLTVAGQLNVDAAATFDTSITVTGDSTLNGNVTLGDASTDLITQTGTLYLNGPVKDTTDTLGAVDQVLLSDATGELTFTDLTDISVGAAEVVEVPVKNLQGSPLTKGDPVFISGSVGTSGRLEVQLADASNAAKMPALGLLKQDLAINEEGLVVVTGKLRNLITDPIDGATPLPNDVIYVKGGGTTGNALTLTKPTGTDLIQNIGKVGRVSTANDGTFVVSSILRTNDVPNLTQGKIWVGSTGNTIESSSITFTEATGAVQLNQYGTSTITGTTAYNLAVDATGNVIETPHTLEDLSDTEIESGRVRLSTLSTGGSGYTVANNVPTTGGSGTGLEINILTLGVGDSIATYSIAPIRDGANYVAGDVVTVNAGNVDATITIDETWPTAGNTLVYNGNDSVWINDPTLTVDYINKRVGIGTVSPSVKLHVDGKVRFRNEVQLSQQNNNSFAGDNAGNLGTIAGAANAGFGKNVMAAATTANNNSILGYNAFNAALTGNRNVAIGSGAIGLTTAIGEGNVAIGYQTLQNGTGGNNIAIGQGAMSNGTGGSSNVSIGRNTLVNNTVSNNVAVGERALQNNTIGAFNTAVGAQSLNAVTGGTGRQNIGLGFQAGSNITTGQGNILIGTSAQASSPTVNNEIVIGNNAVGIGDNSVAIGNTSTVKTELKGNVGIGTASPNSKLQVDGAVQVANDTDVASADKVGALRYYTSGNNSYVDMCMQTGATTYAWVNVVQNNW